MAATKNDFVILYQRILSILLFTFLWVLLFLTLLPISSACAQQRDLVAAEAVTIDAHLVEQAPGEFEATVNVSNIMVGSQQRLRLVLHNAAGQSTVRLSDEPQASCSCISLDLSSFEIPPAGSVVADLVLRVSGAERNPSFFQTVSFASKDESSIVRIKLLGRVAGLLAVDPKQFVAYAPLGQEKSPVRPKVPVTGEAKVTVTSPVRLDSLKISGPDSLNLADVRLVKESETKATLVVSIDPATVPDGGLVLPITLTDEESGRKATAVATFVARRAISVSPSIVRMFAQSDGSLKGAAILSRRVYDRADVADAGKVTPLVADASIGMHTPAISIAAAGPTAARATITMPKAMVEMLRDELRNGDADQHIAWDIHWGDTRASAVTEFQVMD